MQMTKDKIYDNEFYNSLSEIDAILDYMKITSSFPEKFIKFIKENKNYNYNFQYDENCSLSQQKITETTKQILAILYSQYFCTNEQREELENIWRENNKIKLLQSKLNKNQKEIAESNSMIKYSEPFFMRILKKIKELFKKR